MPLPGSDRPIRFAQIPTFGRDTIRRIPANASEQKKLAARDYEDYLQVSRPNHHSSAEAQCETVLHASVRRAIWEL
jgi:hypothetical protein